MELFLIYSTLLIHLIIKPIIIYKQINYWFYEKKKKFYLSIFGALLFLVISFVNEYWIMQSEFHIIGYWGMLLSYPFFIFYLYFNKKFKIRKKIVLFNGVLIEFGLFFNWAIYDFFNLNLQIGYFNSVYYEIIIFIFLYFFILLNLIYLKKIIEFNCLKIILFLFINFIIYVKLVRIVINFIGDYIG